jgi:2-oxoglutarate dehydrogenase E1 component
VSGKIVVELEAAEARAASPEVAVARVEQLAPFQGTALRTLLDRYPNLAEVVWVQEEPRNMGAWGFMEPRLRELLATMGRDVPVRYVGRPERASPAEGFADRHAAEHVRIVAEAFAGAAPAAVGHAANGRAAGTNGAGPANGRPAGAKEAARASD